MTFISYAQNFEDIMLWRALKHVENGFYIDVGAAWPDTHSITKAFYEKGWRGINIEPNPQLYHELCKKRPRDTNLNCAIGLCEGRCVINLVGDTGLSTLDGGIAKKYEASEWPVVQREVDVKTLAGVWQKHVPAGQAVHFLKIDVEGLEEAVLRSNDWQKHRPWIVVVEATVPMSQIESHQSWESILLNAAYQFAYADGLNRFYVGNEHSDLLTAFRYPPNVFDEFKVAGQAQAEARATQAEARATALHQELQFIYNSRSWRLTKPLRAISAAGRQLRSAVLRQKALWRIKPIAESHPGLWTILKRLYFDFPFGRSVGYRVIHLSDFVLYFSLAGLRDPRGIGRVTRILLSELARRSDFHKETKQNQHLRRVYFYSSVHFCPESLPKPSVVMIHDVIPLAMQEKFPRHVVNEWNVRFKKSAQEADAIVTISRTSATDIVKYLNVPPEKVHVIYNPVEMLAQGQNASIKGLPQQEFVVFIGSYDHHKNVEVVLRALKDKRLCDLHFVLIGDNRQYEETVRKFGLQDRVHFLGRLSDSEVRTVLEKSLALVLPSLYEGFGLPPLEAALLKVPSICSRRPPMTELLEGGAIFADPLNEREWADAILLFMEDHTARKVIGENAYIRAKQFGVEVVVDRLLDIVDGLVMS
ncbi:MAG: FkbM family methyltransferase [Tepidimonas ignava]|uniref:FkbM family methyltransferase n=1 Tax=Tepidimonas ignava TaxID=114249 RepID=UPI00391DE76B